MPKKKKTREQKMTADKRRKAPTPAAILTTTTIKESTREPLAISENKEVKSPNPIATKGYSYLLPDLYKTVFLTITIIIAEYILFIVLF